MTTLNTMDQSFSLKLSDDDIFKAMKEIPGYLDITPGDFKEIYLRVYRLTLQRISTSVLAQHIMSQPVITVRPEMSLQEAATLMATQQISGVPVVDADNLVLGMLTEQDFLSNMGQGLAKSFMDVISGCLSGTGCGALAIRKKFVQDIMSAPAITAMNTTTCPELSALLKSRGINRIPITNQHEILTGIVCREDIVHIHGQLLTDALDQS